MAKQKSFISHKSGKSTQRAVFQRQLKAEFLERRELMAADLQLGSIPKEPAELVEADRAHYASLSNGSSGSELVSLAPLADTFRMHSRPTATKTIFLDFDGFTAIGTAWNAGRNRDPIVSPAWDPDGDGPGFTDNELRRIQGIWQRVTADFSPFDVNVTTEDPGQADLVNSGGSDERWGIRVVFTPDDFPGPGSGGVAYINSFNWGASPGATDTPTYVFNMSEVAAAAAASHEVGHTLGLSHDGTTAAHPSQPNQAYYNGHGTGENSWGPIMGVGGYYTNVTTWDNGSYFAANNGGSNANFGDGPDDLLIITTQNGFGYVSDPEANNLASATTLNSTIDYSAGLTNISQFGVISTTGDTDFFRFQTGTGIVNLTFDPYVVEAWVKAPDGTLTRAIEGTFTNSTQWSQNQGANLDISATLYDANGVVIATSDPAGLRASFTNLSLNAGTYYVSLDGVGFGTPAANPPIGYTEYASIGQYLISGTLPVALGFVLPPGPVVYVEDQDPVQVTDTVTVFDGIAGDYSNSQLAVTISPVPGATDRLGTNFAITGLVFNNGRVEDGGQVIAVLNQNTPTRLSWNLTANTTIASIEKLVRSVTFQAQGNAPETRARGVQFQLSKGSLTTNDQIAISVTPTNDAPLLNPAAMTPIAEDGLPSAGQTVGAIFTTAFSDPDPGDRIRGVAIVGNMTPAAQGVWQLGFGGNWQALPNVSTTARLALDLNARLRFLPATDYFGTTAPLLVQAIDSTYSGAFSRASGLVNLSPALQGAQSPVAQTASPLTIEVTPVNDAPRAQVADLRFSVTQDQPLDAEVPASAVIDIDDTILTYTATRDGGAPLPSWLELDPISGVFSGTPGSLDVGSLQLILTVADPGRLQTTLPVIIDVINVNDAPTDLALVGNTAQENTNGARVGQLFSFDVDGDQVFWSSSDARFVVRDNELFLSRALDFEIPSNRQIAITLRATDTGSPALSTDLEVMIHLTDVNEFFPTLVSKKFDVIDGTKAGTLIEQLVAVDGDTEQTVRYRLAGGDAQHFTVDQLTGDFRFATDVDINRKSEYKVFVEAYDDGSPAFSSTAQFIINVQIRNEFAPEFAVDGKLRFTENAPAGTLVGQIPVTDQDGNPLRYQVLAVTGGALDWVVVDPLTGAVRLTAAHRFDFESTASFALQVRVEETVPNGRVVTGTVPIELINANDRPSGVSPLTIYPSRQGVTVTSGFVVQDQDPSTSGYTISTPDTRFEIRNGRLALRPDQIVDASQIGLTISVPLLIVDNSDSTSFSLVMAPVLVADVGAWQNPVNPLDVNRDGIITASDAIAIINMLNDTNSQRLLPPVRLFNELNTEDVDTTGEGFLSAADALLVINELNEVPNAGGEGESQSSPVEVKQPITQASDQLWHLAYSQLEEELVTSRRRR